MTPRTIRDFDAAALYAALDARRIECGLTWTGVANEIWAMSSELNATRPNDHPISPSTLTSVAKRGATSCQHALFMLHWLETPPEAFLAGPGEMRADATLPACGPDRRLRWRLKALHEAVDAQRRDEALTWTQLAEVLRCTPSQVTAARTARFAIGIGLAMRMTQWLDQPAAAFIRAAKA